MPCPFVRRTAKALSAPVMATLAFVASEPSAAQTSPKQQAEKPAPAGEVRKPVVTARLLRRACHAVWTVETTDPLKALCDLKPPDAQNLKQWWALPPTALPDYKTVADLAKKLPESEWVSIRTSEPKRLAEIEQHRLTGVVPPGPGVNALLWGLSDFLVQRGKEQLQVTVVSQVTSHVCSPGELQKLLDYSCALLAPPGGASTLPGAAALRAAVRSDLVQLPGTAVGFAMSRQKWWPDLAVADAAHVIRLTGYFIGSLLDKRAPLNAFTRLAGFSMMVGDFVPFSEAETPAAMYLYLTAAVLATTDRDSVVVNENWPAHSADLQDLYAIKAAVLNASNAQPFMWARPAAAGAKGTQPCKFVWCDALLGLQGRLNEVRRTFGQIDALAAQLNAAATDEERLAIRLGMMNLALDFVGRIVGDVSTTRPEYWRVAVGLDALGDIARDVVTRDFAALTVGAVWLADTLGLGGTLPKNAARTLSFASDIALATDANGVDDALNRFVGQTTYLRKRSPDTGFYLFVNAYAGAAFGREDACTGAKKCGTTAKFAGAYFPVGVEVGHPITLRGVSKVFRSVGLFAQAIDLGALATWRLQNEESDISSAPEVGVKQVFSPGLNVALGVRGLPLTLTIGRTLSPSLRKVTTATGTEERNAVRWPSIGLSVDIPIYP